MEDANGNIVNKKTTRGVVSGRNARSTEYTTEGRISKQIEKDSRAKSDLVLLISSSELKQIKAIHPGKSGNSKASTHLKSQQKKPYCSSKLMLQKINDGEDVREHLRKFFDVINKLNGIDIEINSDLLAIMLLYSLLSSFENFRYVIKSRDKLLTPKTH